MKKLILTTAFAVYAVLGFSQTPYWSYGFENGAMTDAIGNDDLTQSGSALTTVNDRFSSTNDAVNLGGDYLVGGTTGAGSYSVSLWIKDAVNDATDRIIADQFHDNYGFRLRLHNGVVKVTHRFGYSVNNNPYQGSSTGYLVGTTDVADGNWHHVVLTAREYITNGFEYNFQYKLYIDGVQEDTDVRTVSMISGANRQHEGLAGGSTFAVGTNSVDNPAITHYENTIDDIAFYKEDLTAAEVTAIYTARPAMTIYVDEDATGANDGSSWTNAFTSLKDATDFASIVGDQIWVAEGTYAPHATSRTTSFSLEAGVSLYGGFNGTETALSQRDWRTYETVLSGDLSGNDNANVAWSEATRSENSYRILVINGDNTLIDGVTISGGHGNHASDNNYNRGAAISKFNAINTLEVRNCVIENNVANIVAGIKAEYSSSSAHTANIENCTFNKNVSRYGSSYMVSILAGIGTATVSNCLMAENEAINIGTNDGFSGPGGFLDSRAGSTLDAEVVNCTFIDNINTGTHAANSETSTIAARRHGGTFNLTVANCVFDGNTASKSIGRMNTSNCPNTALLVNNVRPDVASTVCSTSSISETALTPTLDANGRPLAGSNTIDAGDNNYTVGTSDIDGNNRIMNSTIDMGAFEFDASACSPITQQPASISGCEGDDISFSVGTTGTIVSYQWKFNGVDISGATSSTVTINNVNSFNVGNYEVAVEASCGTVTSSVATFTLNTATPTITTQPVDASGCESDDVLVSVGAMGSGLTYQWQKGGVDVSGATSASYFFDGIDASEAGNYTVIVGGAGLCPITSNIAVVTVNTVPSITQHPTDQLDCLGGSVMFTATASGADGTQWYKGNSPVAGELSPSLTLTNLVVGDVGAYKIIAYNSCGFIYSDAAQLNIGSTTAPVTQPQSAEQCEGTNVMFQFTVTGTNIGYQWRKDGNDISGANGQFLSINSIAASDEATYTCVATGACGTETSSNAVLTVPEPAAISTSVPDFTECEGEDVTFSVGATGDGLSYAWIDQNGYMAGETASSLSLTNVQLSDAGSYTVEVSGTCGSTVVDAGDLTVNAATTITQQPVSQTICEGEDVTFTVAATGDGLAYNWRKGNLFLLNETSSILEMTNTPTSRTGLYEAVVVGTCGQAVSDPFDLVVTSTPVPVISENMGMLETGVYDTYQWYLDGSPINGETNATVAVGAPGDYTVEVTVNGCTGTSAPYTPMTVGIDENINVSINAYPNPFNDVLNLNLEALEGQVELEVMDMTGRVVFTSVETSSRVQLNLNELTTGTYVLSVRGNDGVATVSRLVKN